MKNRINEAAEKRFWEFVRKRQLAWFDSKILKTTPSYNDKIIESKRFCNIYRFLDRGTLYPIEKFLWYKKSITLENLIFQIATYRILNDPDTWENIGLSLNKFNPATFKSKASHFLKSGRKLYDGHSYMAFTRIITKKKGMKPIDRLTMAVEKLALKAKELSILLSTETNAEIALDAIRFLSPDVGIGKFCAFQILLDLTYPRIGALPLSPIDINQWVHFGPGSKKASLELNIDNPLTAAKILCSRQPKYFPFLIDLSGNIVKLSLPDIEGAMCEWFKYERAKVGGFSKKYRPISSRIWQPIKWYPPWISGKIKVNNFIPS